MPPVIRSSAHIHATTRVKRIKLCGLSCSGLWESEGRGRQTSDVLRKFLQLHWEEDLKRARPCTAVMMYSVWKWSGRAPDLAHSWSVPRSPRKPSCWGSSGKTTVKENVQSCGVQIRIQRNVCLVSTFMNQTLFTTSCEFIQVKKLMQILM